MLLIASKFLARDQMDLVVFELLLRCIWRRVRKASRSDQVRPVFECLTVFSNKDTKKNQFVRIINIFVPYFVSRLFVSVHLF